MISPDTTTQPLTFPVDGPVTLAVRLGSGDVEVTATESAEATVELTPVRPGDTRALDLIDESRVELRGDSLLVHVPAKQGAMRWRRTPPVRVKVTVPTGSAVNTEVGSADLRVDGGIGDLDVETGSGDITVASCADARIRSGSGDVRVGESHAVTFKSGSGDFTAGRCAGDVTAESGSGDVRVDALDGNARITTASGDVELGQPHRAVAVKTASGDVAITRASEGELTVSTASGDIGVGVLNGTATRLECASVTGRVRSQLEPSDAPADTERRLLVNARSVTGDISIHRVH